MRSSKPTISDVARLAGVHKASASTVLNGSRSNTRVSPTTRQRILDAAAELNYHANAVARGLIQGRMHTLGLVLGFEDAEYVTGPYFGPLLKGILTVARRRHQFITIFQGTSWAEPKQNLSTYCDGRTDGLLLFAPQHYSDIVTELAKTNVPLVVIGDQNKTPNVTHVDVDNTATSLTAVNYLLDCGHRRIAALFGDDAPYAGLLRFQGYKMALEERGIPVDERLILSCYWAEHAFREPIQALMALSPGERPTAFFCWNDEIAIFAIHILNELGVRIPEDVSVIGFDGLPEGAAMVPPLTSIYQNPRLTGERAVELLLDQIENGTPRGHVEIMPSELVIRDSVAPPRSS